MRARRLLGAVGDVSPDMTPMIDCVFQLMIFFILCTEVAAADLELLTLPTASEAIPNRGSDDRRLVLNVTQGGEVRHRGRVQAPADLARLLKLHASLVPDREKPGLSGAAVIVRGDTGAEYRHVNAIMRECAHAGIWKLELGAATPHDTK